VRVMTDYCGRRVHLDRYEEHAVISAINSSIVVVDARRARKLAAVLVGWADKAELRSAAKAKVVSREKRRP
jgi:hypothetical protein